MCEYGEMWFGRIAMRVNVNDMANRGQHHWTALRMWLMQGQLGLCRVLLACAATSELSWQMDCVQPPTSF